MKSYRVSCLKINLKKPVLICRPLEALEIKEMPLIALDTEGKRAFSVRLGEALKGLATGKKSIRDIKKPKKKRRRRKKKK